MGAKSVADYRLHQGSSVELKGRLKPSRGAGQAVELLVEETKVIGECDPAVSTRLKLLTEWCVFIFRATRFRRNICPSMYSGTKRIYVSKRP